jgi:hypothetical protein
MKKGVVLSLVMVLFFALVNVFPVGAYTQITKGKKKEKKGKTSISLRLA